MMLAAMAGCYRLTHSGIGIDWTPSWLEAEPPFSWKPLTAVEKSGNYRLYSTRSIQFSPDSQGLLIAYTYVRDRTDGAAQIATLDLASGKLLPDTLDLCSRIQTLRTAPDGSVVLAAANDDGGLGKGLIARLVRSRETVEVQGDNVAAFFGRGSRIAYLIANGSVDNPKLPGLYLRAYDLERRAFVDPAMPERAEPKAAQELGIRLPDSPRWHIDQVEIDEVGARLLAIATVDRTDHPLFAELHAIVRERGGAGIALEKYLLQFDLRTRALSLHPFNKAVLTHFDGGPKGTSPRIVRAFIAADGEVFFFVHGQNSAFRYADGAVRPFVTTRAVDDEKLPLAGLDRMAVSADRRWLALNYYRAQRTYDRHMQDRLVVLDVATGRIARSPTWLEFQNVPCHQAPAG